MVTVSSNGHKAGQIHFDDLNFRRRYRRMGAYGQSKLANLLFTYELQRRTDPAGGGGGHYGHGGVLEITGAPVRVQSNGRSHDVEVQRRLWAESETLTGVGYPV